ncbi:hypothetical protein RB595_003948 [Gaeumannomyces hyphopodioides]
MIGTGVFVAVFHTVGLLLVALGCIPVKATWELNLDGKAKCLDMVTIIRATTWLIFLMDITPFLIPAWCCLGLQISIPKRVAISLAFAGGLVTCSVTILRYFAITGLRQLDITYSVTSTLNYTYLELTLGIVCASIPRLRPLFDFAKKPQHSCPGPPSFAESQRIGLAGGPRSHTSASSSELKNATSGVCPVAPVAPAVVREGGDKGETHKPTNLDS